DLGRSVVPAMRPIALQRGVQLIEQVQSDVRVWGDQTRLTQLVINLIDNALRYTPTGGAATVSVARVGASAILRVEAPGVCIYGDPRPKRPRLAELLLSRFRFIASSSWSAKLLEWLGSKPPSHLTHKEP